MQRRIERIKANGTDAEIEIFKGLSHGFGLGLPHIYRSNFGRDEEYFICTADPKYFKAGQRKSTSAASALSWACKWIILCEMWLNGEIGDDVAMEGNY